MNPEWEMASPKGDNTPFYGVEERRQIHREGHEKDTSWNFPIIPPASH